MRIASNSAFRCLVVAQFILAQLAVQALSAPTAKTATPEDLAREVARRMDLLEAVGKETPRESFDPAAVLAKLGDKPSAAEIFAFVRNRTHFVPYRGSLRGSRGVLMDRTGNSLDRALLLAELLRRSGRKVRLATASLSAPQAKGVLEAAGRLPKDLATPKMTTARRRTKATVLRLAARFALDAAAFEKDLQTAEDTISQAAKHAATRIEKQTKVLAAMLQAVVICGVLDFDTKRFGTSEAMLRKALNVREEDPLCHYYLGKIALETGSDTRAVDRPITRFNKAIEYDSKYAPAYRDVGLAYYRKGNNKLAIKNIEEYLKLEPEAKDAKHVRMAIEDLKQE